ncbi:MAG: pyridoxal 5'-phosphate synthase glutaminase subunit PdxT [Acidobacteriia bacterium]|nr:pyridoxal 5'-phosphate synthase glutaminase subunit PdxT [Terriglobia bacterium]
MARIGVLALQGDFEAHRKAIERLGVAALEVRRCAELARLDGLVLPGGESTTLLNLMRDEPWFEALRRFHRRGGAFLATCAGAILLSRRVLNPVQPSLGLLDAVVERNGWGRQVDSFETRLDVPALSGPVDAVFIRAPRFKSLGRDVSVLARFGGEPVLVRHGRILAMTFHPELTGDGRLHRHFVEMADRRRRAVDEDDVERSRAVAS